MFRRLVDEGRVSALAAAAFGISLVLALLLVPLVRKIAHRVDAIDHPGDGKAHGGATPYFGGVAIGVAALAVPSLFRGWPAEASFIFVAALMVAVTGLVDDLRNLHPLPRVAVECLAAGLAVHAGAKVTAFGPWVGAVLSVLLIVVITNSFNLLDNMDGCAGIIASSTAAALMAAAILERQVLVAGLAAAILGSCLGFLFYNWHPASIFMGDAGSLFLGFLVSVVALKLRTVSASHFQSITGVALMLAVPLFDTTLVVISRVSNGLSILQGGKDHLSHRLRQVGLSIRLVATVLGMAAAASSALGVAVTRGKVNPWFAIAATCVLLAATMAPLLRMDVYTAGSRRGTR